MKVALVVPGGVDRSGVDRVVPVYLALIKQLAKRHEVHVFALRHEAGASEWDLFGARIHNIGTERGRGRRFFSQFSSEHREGAFDVVHAIHGWEAAYASAIAWWHRIPLLFQASGGEFVSMPECGYGMRSTFAGRVALRIALAVARRVTVESTYMHEMAAGLGVHTDMNPLGVDLDEWPPGEVRRRAATQPLRLLHVGDIRPVKDQATLLAAASALRARGVDFQLDIAGSDTMGGTMQRCDAAVGLGTAVRWHGLLRRTALRALMDQADLLVVSSRHEADPMVLLEAAIAGVPTVGTSVGHIPDWAVDSAVAVPIGDSAALAREIAALAADEPRRISIAQNAQRRAIAMDADAMAAGFESLYSEMVVDFVPAADPFGADEALPHSYVVAVLGLPITFSTNSRYVRGLVEEAFGATAYTASRNTVVPPLRVRIVVRAGDEDGTPHAAVAHCCPDETRVLLQTRASKGVSDPLNHESIAHVTTTLAADRAHFRREFVEALTYALVSHFDRHPVHAAAIAHDGRAVLLAGASGTGKSTLAYLAHREGISVLGDDTVWVQMEPALRIWGRPGTARLTADAVTHFPELQNSRTVTIDGDKSGVALRSRASENLHAADSAVVCLIERGSSAALERVSVQTLSNALAAQLAPGFDRFPKRVDEVFGALAANGGWRLTLSADPHDALPLLRRALGG